MDAKQIGFRNDVQHSRLVMRANGGEQIHNAETAKTQNLDVGKKRRATHALSDERLGGGGRRLVRGLCTAGCRNGSAWK